MILFIPCKFYTLNKILMLVIPLCAQNQKDLELSLLKEQIQKEKVLEPVLTETLMEK